MDRHDGDALSRLPGFVRSTTAAIAAQPAELRIPGAITGTHARLVYEILYDAGQEGATDFQIEIRAGIHSSSLRTRRSELRDMGYVEEAPGQLRTPLGRMATRWRLRQDVAAGRLAPVDTRARRW